MQVNDSEDSSEDDGDGADESTDDSDGATSPSRAGMMSAGATSVGGQPRSSTRAGVTSAGATSAGGQPSSTVPNFDEPQQQQEVDHDMVADWQAARVAAVQRGDMQAAHTYDFLGRAARSSQCSDWQHIDLKNIVIYACGSDPKTFCDPHGVIRPRLYLDYARFMERFQGR